MELDLDPTDLEGPFECASCGVLAVALTDGWRRVRPDDENDELAFLCSDCAAG
jgi:hypothetical protein